MRRDDCTVVYDRNNRRLAYYGRPANEGYWDEHWVEEIDERAVRVPSRFVLSYTKRYLPLGSRVLDAGCGLANTVFGLHQSGYDAYGVDYAKKTVDTVKRHAPELKVQAADVRDLSLFADGFFDGVWSLGVIEHFYDGFGPILSEMTRVIRPGGFAFVTVPSMSPIRRLKAVLGRYAVTPPNVGEFYQFILPREGVVPHFERVGFRLMASHSRGGFKGLKDELRLLRTPMQTFYESRNKALRATRAGLDVILSPVAHHTRLYVFRKAA